MDLPSISHVPKWAIVGGGGVGVGVIALRTIRKRNAAAAAATTTDGTGTTSGSAIDNSSYGTTGSGATSVIVPPVIQQATSGEDGSGAFLGTYLNGVDMLLGDYGSFADQQTGLINTQFANTLQAVSAGSDIATQGFGAGSDTSAGAYQAAITSGLTGGGAPATPAPNVVTGPAPVPQAAVVPVAPKKKTCSGSYPNLSEADNLCYKVVCASGKEAAHLKGKWWYFENGFQSFRGTPC